MHLCLLVYYGILHLMRGIRPRTPGYFVNRNKVTKMLLPPYVPPIVPPAGNRKTQACGLQTVAVLFQYPERAPLMAAKGNRFIERY